MHSRGSAIHIASVGHVVFAAVMIFLGIQGWIKGDFTTVWQPVPKSLPVRQGFVYLSASISLACGIGLLWRRTAALAARVLLVALVLWPLLWRVRALFLATLVDSTWNLGSAMAMIAAAWVLYVTLATNSDRQHLGFASGDKHVRIARALYGVALIPFGYAHFAYLKHTADMVPDWLPWHFGWAVFTGITFIAASLAILTGRFARQAAALSTLQMGLFGLLVWIPLMAAGPLSAFQQGEVVTTVALTAAGWVVTDSYRAVTPANLKQ
ncbi:MAG TPA: hypothetical protein VKU19_33645 [Bryobacteraceae bacterium]|nr:hypothetical protein [Bryobacteraceae bacterium]